MREMKYSRIEWVDAIPSNWSEKPFRVLFHEITEKNRLGYYKNALKFTYGEIIPKSDFDADTDDYVADTILSYTVVTPGTIMINCLNLNYDFISQRIGLVKDKGIITSAYLAIKAFDINVVDERYANYQLKSFDSIKAFHNMGTGIRKTLGFDELGKKYFILPSIQEQHRIADFLDAKCAEIDALRADIEKEIETLEAYKKSVITEAVTRGLDPNVEMNDSGIEWIGKTPLTWTIVPLKYSFDIISGATPDSTNSGLWDGDVIWVTPADFKTKDYYVFSGHRNISTLGYKSCSTTIVPVNSIIFSKRAPIGSVVINKTELCTNQGCLACIPKGKANVKFFYYIMSVCEDIFNLYGSGTTFKEISAAVFGNMRFQNPPIKEQNAIVDFLDSKCSEIDAMISSKEKQINTLDTYKKSVIYEYVTGKKEVSQFV